MKKVMSTASFTLALLALTLPVFAQNDGLPNMTTEGLPRVDTRRVDALYWETGATLAPYNRVAILDCPVAFRKNWQRDQNIERVGPYRVEADDMKRIQDALSAEFRTVFTDELTKGGYEVVDVGGEDVLLLRPAIMDLDVTSPEVDRPGMSEEFVTNAGAMTLYLELYDSATSDLIGRVVDRRNASTSDTLRFGDSVSNRVEADRMLRRWATLLVNALDDARNQ